MALLTITINVPNANVARVQAAFGHPTSLFDPTWVNATNTEIQDAVTEEATDFIRRKTRLYEAQLNQPTNVI